MEKRGVSIWDTLAWIVLASIVFWVILKITGIINTPDLLEYYPFLAASYAFGWQMHKIQIISKEIIGLKKFQKETVYQINEIKLNCIKNHL